MTEKKHSKRQKLEREINQKQAQLQDLKAREKVKSRKQDTRRKIVAGALALQHSAINDDFNRIMHKLLNDHLKNDRDRILFDLPLIEKMHK